MTQLRAAGGPGAGYRHGHRPYPLVQLVDGQHQPAPVLDAGVQIQFALLDGTVLKVQLMHAGLRHQEARAVDHQRVPQK